MEELDKSKFLNEECGMDINTMTDLPKRVHQVELRGRDITDFLRRLREIIDKALSNITDCLS